MKKYYLISLLLTCLIILSCSQNPKPKVTFQDIQNAGIIQEKCQWDKANSSMNSCNLKIISFTDYYIFDNDFPIDNGVEFTFKNATSKTINAIMIIAYTTDNWNNPQPFYVKDEKIFPIDPYNYFENQNEIIFPNAIMKIKISDDNYSRSDKAKKTEYRVVKIHFTDNTTWEAK